MKRVVFFGVGLCLLAANSLLVAAATEQDLPPLEPPAAGPVGAAPVDAGPVDAAPVAAAPLAAAPVGEAAAALDLNVAQLADAGDDKPIKALNDGPLNEAFLSPPKDREPVYVDKPPPSP